MPAPKVPSTFELHYYGTKTAVDSLRTNLKKLNAKRSIHATYDRQIVSPEVTRVVQTMHMRYGSDVLPYFNNSLVPDHIKTPMISSIGYAFVTYDQAEPGLPSEVKMIITPDPAMMRHAEYRNNIKMMLENIDNQMLLRRFQKPPPAKDENEKKSGPSDLAL